MESRSVPTTLALYNAFMGGVDLSGQLCQYYRIWSTGVKWWHSIFWWLFNASITQAWIVQCQSVNKVDKDRKPLTHVHFKLAQELYFMSDSRVPPSPTLSPIASDSRKSPLKHLSKSSSRLSNRKRSAVKSPNRLCARLQPAKEGGRGRLRCRQCGKKTSWCCSVCAV